MSEDEEEEDEKTEEAKQGKSVESSGQTTETTLTVEHIGGTHVIDAHGPTQPVPFEGQATPGAHVVATASFSNEVQPAQASPTGHYGGQFQQGPTTPGVHTISVESSGQTTVTTFPAKLKKEP